ncbi:MAG TPA: DUF2169 domain-containing protein [Polyangiaceae bacterium]|nr:DUF2169 domain-containing protein [Polyangiaceae bacterium]
MRRINLTPFATDHTLLIDASGFERLLVVVKATYSISGGTPRVADRQDDIVLADEYREAPEASSLRRAGEMPLEKPGTEVVVLGSAYPARAGASEAMVELELGRIRKSVRVVGERVWAGEAAPAMTRPASFERMPLTWERAYGGRDDTGSRPEVWPENPVGRGFRASGSRLPIDGSALPNLEDPANPVRGPRDRPSACGLGPIAPGWSPRPRYAGSYGPAYMKERFPFLPDDFNPLYHHAAPHDQILPGPLAGNEVLTLTGVRPGGGAYHFPLPAPRSEIVVRIGAERVALPARVDTIVVDTDAERLSLIARASVSVHMRLHRLSWIKIQEAART